ncbi:MAG: Flp pilus assembly complex ATPase component TadA, partial [Deltaproteobacteria bacterium]|nr:Flp pilus assembly complex ATPase component TadA [Deltaproteobacteria bacterium]
MSETAIQGRGDATSLQISQLEEKLNLRKRLQNITNRINAAQNLKQILVDFRDETLNLLDAHSITIYVADREKKEIYAMFLAGSELKQIRLPINNRSIAGYVANSKKEVNITDAYSDEELKKIDRELSFDSSWDKKSGFRTREVLAVPVMYENTLMGVVQVLNKKSGGRFTDEDRGVVEEIAAVLGIAFTNQERIGKRRKTRFSGLINHGIVKEEDIEKAMEEAHQKRQTVEDYLIKEMKVSKEAIGTSLEEFYNCRFVQFNDKQPVPFELLRKLKEEYLRRELWVPLEKKDGRIRIIIDDPNNIIKRDMIENLLSTRNVDYDVALYEDIKKYINHFYQAGGGADSATIGDIIGKLDAEEEQVFEGDDEFSESDSIIMQLVNRVINDAYNRNASDIHIEPNMAKKNVEVRYRVDGALMIYQSVPFSYRSAMVSRIKIMSNLDITERRIPQDGKIKFRRPKGDEIELRVATIPTQGGLEDVVMRILAKGETMPLEAMGLGKRNYDCLTDIIAKPYGMVLVVGPTGSGKTTTLHAALYHINKPDTKIWTAEDPV